MRLLERIAARPDHAASVQWGTCSDPLLDNSELLFTLETLIHGLPRPGPATSVTAGAFARDETPAGVVPDLLIDLCGDVPAGTGVWRLTVDGCPGEAGLLASVLDGRAPVATLHGEQDVVATGRLGTEMPGIALAAFEDGLKRVTTLILAALDGAASKTLPAGETRPKGTPIALTLPQTGLRAGKALARALVRRLYYLAYRAPHWRVGWRRTAGSDLWALRRHPAEGWTDLPDDGLRFYADPFPIVHAGRLTLFVEEFDHRRQKGVISALVFNAQGPVGRPQPVLDLPYHLSYPFVFAQDGALWMIPESCAAGTIDLYRATNFPGGWVHEARLVEGVVASDATLLQQDGRWWMFATVRDDGGAFSDTLHLWSAPDFRGPWTPHAQNPVLIDIASARPAGRIVARDGTLLRPVQDCRAGYGNALGLARILRLDEGGFEQVVDTILHAGPGWPGRRLHTLNEAGGFEFIDGSANARRTIFRAGSRQG